MKLVVEVSVSLFKDGIKVNEVHMWTVPENPQTNDVILG